MVTKKQAAGAAKTVTAETTAAAVTPPQLKGPSLKLKDLVDQVAAASGAKKKDAKTVAEATLAALGAALDRGEELNLPGLGRARVVKSAEKSGAQVLTLKLRRGGNNNASKGKEPLADAGEDG